MSQLQPQHLDPRPLIMPSHHTAKSNDQSLILVFILLATFNKDGHPSSLRCLLHLTSRPHTLLVFLLMYCSFCMFHLIPPTLQHWAAPGLRPQTFPVDTHWHVISSSLMAFNHFYTEGPKFISPAPTSPLLQIPTWIFKSHFELTMHVQITLDSCLPPKIKPSPLTVFPISGNCTASYQLPRP